MEFGVVEKRKTINVTWNGPSEKLCRKIVISSISPSHNLKVYLHYPKMPVNHVMCMIGRLRKAWTNTVGNATAGAEKAHDILEAINTNQKLLTDDEVLVEILEALTLDNIAPDIDLLAIKKWNTGERMNSIWAFCFAPDDIDHFLKNVRVSDEQLCYGRNGDLSL